MAKDQPNERYIPDAPQHREGGTWPPAIGQIKPPVQLPDIAKAVEEGMNLINGELMPLIEARKGADKAQEIREMVTPYVHEFHTDEPVRTLISMEELSAQGMLGAEMAGELFHNLREVIATNPDWENRYGKSSANVADKRVRGLIARLQLTVSANPAVGGQRLYDMTDFNRYERDREKAA